jgi:hypothetical protein
MTKSAPHVRATSLMAPRWTINSSDGEPLKVIFASTRPACFDLLPHRGRRRLNRRDKTRCRAGDTQPRLQSLLDKRTVEPDTAAC